MEKPTDNKHVKTILTAREVLLLQSYLKDLTTEELMLISECFLSKSLLRRAVENEINIRTNKLTESEIFDIIFKE